MPLKITSLHTKRQTFYENLQEVIHQTNPEETTIIAGDFNARIGNDVIPGIKNRFNETHLNENGELLIEFCLDNELRINNTFFDHKDQHKYTWENNMGHRTIIDYVVTNRMCHPSNILDIRSLTSADIGSDHNLVLAKLRTTLKREKTIPRDTISKINIQSLQDGSTQKLYRDRLDERINNNGIREEDDIETAWEKIKTNILKSAEEALGKINRKSQQKQRRNIPWYTEEVKEITREKLQAFLKYKQSKLSQDYEEYKLIRNQVNIKIRKIKQNYWESFTARMEHDFYGLQKQIWRFIRNTRSETNELISTTKISNTEWVEYFSKLFHNNEAPVLDIADTLTQDYEISEEQIIQTIPKLKNRKSPAEDGIYNELLKYGGNHYIKN